MPAMPRQPYLTLAQMNPQTCLLAPHNFHAHGFILFTSSACLRQSGQKNMVASSISKPEI